ncbi:MAG: hypothetical protein PF483_12790 [Halothiobacillus sp.]|jgi:hypothetical protein|nr:hypothetical protein [Halothiobacillus sp.]
MILTLSWPRLFAYLGVTPMSVAELREYFAQEWHFMGNASLFKFDGVIRRSSHEVPARYRRWIHALSGVEGHADRC